ncbi:MAG TPA: hypothetical protein VFT70_12090 [Nocardioides sp.]|nr:hypothetical protein [Nocardioides sp.]
MAERREPRPPHHRLGRHRGYQDWQIVQGIPEQDALDEARRRQAAREDAHRIKADGGFDADLFFGTPSYATGGAAGRHAVAEAAPDEQDEPDDG